VAEKISRMYCEFLVSIVIVHVDDGPTRIPAEQSQYSKTHARRTSLGAVVVKFSIRFAETKRYVSSNERYKAMSKPEGKSQ
jgi:hypothetical protein